VALFVQVDRLYRELFLVVGPLGLIAFGKTTLPKNLDQLVLIVPVLILPPDELVDALRVLGRLRPGLGVGAFVGGHGVLA
jgi:hypothetical protein